MFIEREITSKIQHLLSKFPIVTLTGTRQCGKSTLLRNKFRDYRYVSLEDLDIRKLAINDPRSFLSTFKKGTIIDEAQYAPDLFSYIQTEVDKTNESGAYILSGSHNFLLMQCISQSLAGRTAVLKLTPLSISELTKSALLPDDANKWLFAGGFPRIYDKQIAPNDFFPSYIQTYIERDVRLLQNILNLSQFVRFLKLCAGRIGQLLNVSSLANECGINVKTANSWLSILETSYVVFLLKPYYKNYNKRLIKSPKLYFYDTGLASSLLGLENERQLSTHYLRGGLFENMIIAEYLKNNYNQGKEPAIFFWRDSNGNEVDLLIEQADKLRAVEIKSSATIHESFFDGLKHFQSISGISNSDLTVVFGGNSDFSTSKGYIVSWKNWAMETFGQINMNK